MVGIARLKSDERGASLVEFALLLPIFVMLVLGLFSGGLTYNQKLSLTHAAREGARYGAALPKGASGPTWTDTVRRIVEERAAGDFDLAEAGHWLCIALVQPDGTVEPGYQLIAGPVPASYTANCSTTNAPSDFNRVNVAVGRPGKIEWLIGSSSIDLRSTGTARYERT